MGDQLRLFTIHERGMGREIVYRDTVVATDTNRALEEYREKIGDKKFEDNGKWIVDDLSAFLLNQGYVVDIQKK